MTQTTGPESTDAIQEKMRIDSSGNVGIGTSSTGFNGQGLPLVVGSGSSNTGMTIYSGSTGYGTIQFADAVTTGADSYRGVISYKHGDEFMYFSTNAAERMRIDSSGNVGIGTSSPTNKVDILTADNTGLTVRSSNYSGSFVPSSLGGMALVSAGAYPLIFYVNSAERARIDSSGNLLLAGTGTPTSSAGNFVLYNGTAPTGNATNGVILYAEDVSASSELKVRDEAGNVTTLSPHNFDLIPEGPSEDMAWSYYSERDGKRINVDMLKAIRLLEQISGEKLVHMV